MTFATDDQLLVDALRRRDERSLRDAYALYSGRVQRVVRSIVVDQRAAEDVTQEVFLYLWRNAENVDLSRGGMGAFITTVARRRAIDHVRSEVSRRAREDRVAVTSYPGSVGALDFSEDVVHEISRARSSEDLHTALQRLAEDERVAIELAYFHGHTLRQVAVATNSPEGTTKSRVRRALRTLQNNPVLRQAHYV
jgi:RNA polymerase sigma-70 factor, ECF subfamily